MKPSDASPAHPPVPFLLALTLTAFFLWLAENIGTYTHTWSYPGHEWHLVSVQKMGAWGLLLIISFVTVSLVIAPKAPDSAAEQEAGYRQWFKTHRGRQPIRSRQDKTF